MPGSGTQYGRCTKCGLDIDPLVGYSNVGGLERICLPCQFPAGVRSKQRSGVHAAINRISTSTFAISSGPVGRIGMWLGELTRRSRVANEAHSGGRPRS